MNEHRLVDSIKTHEGYRQEPYRDHLGYWTVGWGTLIHDRKVRHYLPDHTLGEVLNRMSSKESHERWLMDSIENAISDCEKWLGFMFRDLSDVRQEVLVEMAYQLGYNRLTGFVKFRAAIADDDWQRARAEMLDSRWHTQTPARAETLADRFEAG